MPIKSVKMKISKNKKNVFLSHGPRITLLKNQVPRSKDVLCSPLTDRRTDRQTPIVTTEGTLSGFQEFFLQPIINDRPNNIIMLISRLYLVQSRQTQSNLLRSTNIHLKYAPIVLNAVHNINECSRRLQSRSYRGLLIAHTRTRDTEKRASAMLLPGQMT